MNSKVLVLGDDTRSFLSVIRSLGRKDIEVHIAWHRENAPELSSRYIHKRHNIMKPEQSSTSWIAEFEALLKAEQFDLVIPCNDTVIIPLQVHRSQIHSDAIIYLLDDEAYNITSNKRDADNLAKKLDIPVPESLSLKECDYSSLEYPIVVKPVSSFTIDNLSQKQVVRKAFDAVSLKAIINNIDNRENFIIQKNFIGDGVGVELLVNKGETLVAFQHRRIHEPLTGGGSSYRKSESLDPELLEAAKSLVSAINYSGVCMVEFKVNRKSGQWIFIELNGRFWGSLPLALAAGVDFPYYLLQMLTEGKTDFRQKYKMNIFCRNLTNDIFWFRNNRKADKSNKALETVPTTSIIKEAVNILLLRERSDTFVLDDPMPGIREIGAIMKQVFNKLTNCFSNYGVEKMYKYDEMAPICANARNILFVCKGNICRSSFAEHYTRTILPEDIEIKSCGHFQLPDRPPPDEAIAAADTFNVDMREHRSAIMSDDLLEWANIIFVFDMENANYIMEHHPSASRKTFLTTALLNGMPRHVDDPFRESVEVFKVTYKLICKCCDKLPEIFSAQKD